MMTIERHSGTRGQWSLNRWLGRAGEIALDLLMPPQCLNCSASIERHGGVCAPCWSNLSFIAGSLCATCGTPFELATGDDAVCGACIRDHPVFDCARAALRYDDAARRLVLAFKRADRTEIAPLLARWMRAAGADMLADAHWLVPVPLHRGRLFWRRFNQAALLAIALGKQSGVPVLHRGLMRTRPTPSQAGLSRESRHRNVSGAFAVGKGAANMISGARIVVVDDVMTTGATVSACARRLRDAGAMRVEVLTAARVVRDGGEAKFDSNGDAPFRT